MSRDAFLDTNILVYAFSHDPRSERASELLAAGCTVGVQGLNEFANVALRKLGMTHAETAEALSVIRTLCVHIEPTTLAVHEQALELAGRYKLGWFDAVMIATALAADCKTFWSEDLQEGMRVQDRITIRNPPAGR